MRTLPRCLPALLASAPVALSPVACDCDPEPITQTECIIAVEPSGDGNEISFAGTAVGQESSRSWRVTNAGTGVSLVDLQVTFESVNGEHYAVEIPEDTRITPGDDATFTVTFRPLAEADLASRFVVSHPDIGNAKCNTATVFVRGTGFLPLDVDAGVDGGEDGGVVDGGPILDGGTVDTPDGGIALPANGEWFAYGAFEDARSGFAAVKLADGDVLAIGGYGEGGIALDSIERFDPVTGRSRIVARMAVPRAEPAAAVLPDGKVLILGGRSAASAGVALRTTEVLDPLDGDTLACADANGCGLEDQDGAAVPVGRIGAFAHATGTHVILVLGRTLDPGGNEQPVAGGDVLTVSPFSRAALDDGGLLGARTGAAHVVDPGSDSFVVIGGRSAAGNVLADVLRVNAATNDVDELDALTVPRAFAAGALLVDGADAGDVLVAGGHSNGGVGLASVERIVDPFGEPDGVELVEDLELTPRVGGTLAALDADILLWTGGMDRRVDDRDADDSELPRSDADVLVPFGAGGFLRFATDNELAQGRFEHQALVVSPDTVLFLGGVATSPRRTPQPHAERYLLEENRFVTWGLMGGGTALEAGLVGSGGALVSAGGVDPHTGRTSNAVRAFDATNGVYVEAGALNAPRRDHTLTRISVDEDQAMLVAGGRDDNGNVLASLSLVDTLNGVDRPLPIGLHTPRAGHTATRLADGNPIANGAVLLCGGVGQGGEAIDNCEVFVPPSNPLDPATFDEGDVIVVVGRMAAGRVNHTATLLDNGEVLLVGGGDPAVDLVTADLFVPAAASPQVRSTGQPQLARRNHAAVFLGDGKVLIVGGEALNNVVGPTDRAELYLRDVEDFVDVGTMEEPRAAPAAFRLGDGNVIVTGGTRSGDDSSAPTRSLVATELYVANADGTGTFEELADVPLSHGRSDVLFLDVFGRAIVAGGDHRDGLLSTGDERRTPLFFVDWLQAPGDAFEP